MIHKKSQRNVLDTFDQRISKTESQISSYINNKAPNVPVYQLGSFPDEAPEGQWAIGDDNAVYFFKDGAWFKFCTGTPV